MRAPPLSVCSGRLRAVRPSTLLRFSFHCASAFCEASMSSTASSVKMPAMSWSKSVSTSSATSTGAAAAAGAGALTTGSLAGKGAGVAATAGATGTGGAGGGAAASSAARAAAMMRPSSCSVAASIRDSSVLCDWKKPVDSSRCAATLLMAVMQSRQQPEVGGLQTHAAVERLAHPMLERRREADAMARFGHARAAGQRVAGAVTLFAHHVRVADVCARLPASATPRRCSPGSRGCRSRAAACPSWILPPARTGRFLHRAPRRRRSCPSPRLLRSKHLPRPRRRTT